MSRKTSRPTHSQAGRTPSRLTLGEFRRRRQARLTVTTQRAVVQRNRRRSRGPGGRSPKCAVALSAESAGRGGKSGAEARGTPAWVDEVCRAPRHPEPRWTANRAAQTGSPASKGRTIQPKEAAWRPPTVAGTAIRAEVRRAAHHLEHVCAQRSGADGDAEAPRELTCREQVPVTLAESKARGGDADENPSCTAPGLATAQAKSAVGRAPGRGGVTGL